MTGVKAMDEENLSYPCTDCAEGTMIEIVGPYETTFDREVLVVEKARYFKCGHCGATAASGEQVDELQKKTVELVREKRNLLGSSEIIALRHQLALSQAEFESKLGAGSKTVVRWEKDLVVQGQAFDDRMKMLRLFSEYEDVVPGISSYKNRLSDLPGVMHEMLQCLVASNTPATISSRVNESDWRVPDVGWRVPDVEWQMPDVDWQMLDEKTDAEGEAGVEQQRLAA
jgi:putative zinc finger/helix-turn-helix YgiT family protein